MVNYERFILDNGMTVILHKDLSSPMVVVNILYKVGSKNEDQKLTGHAQPYQKYRRAKARCRQLSEDGVVVVW